MPEAAFPDQLLQLLDSHVSVRSFTGEPIAAGALERLVRAAQRAPTDATGQLYSFIRVRDRGLRDEVARLSADLEQMRTASELLVVCLDAHRIERLLAHRGEELGMRPLVALLFGITDAALAAQNLVVAAEAMGLGTCYIGALQNHAPEVARLLQLPQRVVPLWGLCIGVPKERAPTKPRLPIGLVLHEDRYREPTPGELDAAYAIMAKATRSGDWLNPIKKYFARGGHMGEREETLAELLRQQGLAP